MHIHRSRLGRFLLAAAIMAIGPITVPSASAQGGDDGSGVIQLNGETRVRLEGLDGQFRANGRGSDQFLAIRTLLKAEVDTGPFAIVAELQDSRGYLSDSETPISASIVNPLDVLQLHARIPVPGLLGAGSRSELRLGRQTVSIGSKRQIERPDFANVIKSYTGAHFISRSGRGDELHALLVVPLAQLPGERDHIEDNELKFDEEQWNRKIWGVHYRRKDIVPQILPGVWGEIFVYGLHETDSRKFPTPNRRYVTPGFRLFKAPAPGVVNFDIEGAWRFGSRRASSAADDLTRLDVSATMLLAKAGYTFDTPWKPNLALQYYHASGDKKPNDGKYGQYERLFGSRRSDLNNTSIYGPLTPANIDAVGARLEVVPSSLFDARLTYSAVYLASATDSWVIARLRDPTGKSGSFVGHAIDSRFRYKIIPGTLGLELGASALIFGRFAKDVDDGPEGNASVYGYTQLTFEF